MEKMQESINKDLEELKNKHTETNNTFNEIKSTLEGINSRISEVEEWISELEDKMEITSEKQNKVKRMKRTEDSLRDLWDNVKCTNIRIIGVTEEQKKVSMWENFWWDYGWKFPQHGKRNSQSNPRRTKSTILYKPQRNMPGQILIKVIKTKHKERILKAAREKQQVTHKGNPICLTADLSAESQLSVWGFPCMLHVASPLMFLIFFLCV